MAREARVDQLPRGVLSEIENCRRWPMYLWGDTGRGKTCAAALAYAMWAQPAYWSSLAELCDLLKVYNTNQTQMIRCASQDTELTYLGFWRKLRTTGLVVIDEIGTRDPAPHRYDAFLRLLDERVNRPLILTGNLHPEKKLGEVYDERIYSRIVAGTLIEVTGQDRRPEGLQHRIKQY